MVLFVALDEGGFSPGSGGFGRERGLGRGGVPRLGEDVKAVLIEVGERV